MKVSAKHANGADESFGIIDTSKIYPLGGFMKTAGMSTWAMREARRRGLRVCKIGRRKFVRGADWDAYLATIDTGA
jgi:hypothetical protein